MKRTHIILMAMTMAMILCCVSASEAKYRIRLQWLPQTQFAGYYMAAEKGFYQEEGVDVEIRPVDPKIRAFHDILYRNGHFETAWLASGILMANASAKKEIVLIAQFFQKSAFMLVTRRSGGIRTISDFRNRSIGVWDGVFSILPRALIKKHNIHGMKLIPQGFTMDGFLNGEIEIASAMRYNEYNQILESGIREEELLTFNFSDLGMNLPEDGLYVRRDFLERSPEVCQKVVSATIRGWQYAFAHKEETIRHITALANQTEHKTTEDKQGWMLYVVEKLMDADNTVLKEADFENTAGLLKSLKMVRNVPSYNAFYKNVMK